MVFYFVGGKPDCPKFVHVAYVCSYLKQHLPNFNFRKEQVESGEWEYWLSEINTRNDWHHIESPIIWKEVGRVGGKATLIGGISDFWEYCYDYYGLESVLPKEDLQNLVEDNKLYFQAEKRAREEDEANNLKIVTVMGIYTPFVCPLMAKLLDIEGLGGKMGVTMRIFDLDLDVEGRLKCIIDMMEGFMELNTTILLTSSFQQALDNCDLLLHLSDGYYDSSKDLGSWYIRNTFNSLMLADNINAYAKKTIRIIFASLGAPVCFNASMLCQNCPRIKLTNVIAITADWGYCALNVVSKECNLPLEELSAPPVWGTLQHNFIDIGSIIKKCDIHRPYLRALNNEGGSTLPLGKQTSELRYIKYLTDGIPNFSKKVDNIKETVQRRLGRPPSYSKISAILKVLEIWFKNKPSDEIISLGILSNGCFGFPPGIVVSQPAVFNGRCWMPYPEFPIQNYAKTEIEKLVKPITSMLEEFDISEPDGTECNISKSVVRKFTL